MLRIIAGEKRGAKIQTLEGMTTRPLRDRIRQALFNILQGRIRGEAVLDLFAGSGAVGLEALSRGAARTVFVEADPAAQNVIRANIGKLGYEAKSQVLGGLLPGALASVRGSFNLVFIMPPYRKNLGPPVVAELSRRGLVAPEGCIVVEIEKGEEWPAELEGGWHIADDRSYGITRLLFLERGEQ
ncbi:MAG: hypothetical protein PWP23_3045 [Candidatus Sumerlaeota bacterium]|nr:hypothetical protein [Candidatus Sumerlaeota bacterium]